LLPDFRKHGCDAQGGRRRFSFGWRRLTYYIVNYQLGHLQAIRSVRDRFINLEKPPASTLIGVATLALPNFLVEVDAIAVVP